MRYGKQCLDAAKDITFSRIISVPDGYNLDIAATVASDRLLEGGGLASWQTPLITARGDILTLAGACRHHIGPVRSDEIQRIYGRSDDARERAYYLHSYDDGLEDTDLKSMTAVQCERAIQRYRRQISKLKPN